MRDVVRVFIAVSAIELDGKAEDCARIRKILREHTGVEREIEAVTLPAVGFRDGCHAALSFIEIQTVVQRRGTVCPRSGFGRCEAVIKIAGHPCLCTEADVIGASDIFRSQNIGEEIFEKDICIFVRPLVCCTVFGGEDPDSAVRNFHKTVCPRVHGIVCQVVPPADRQIFCVGALFFGFCHFADGDVVDRKSEILGFFGTCRVKVIFCKTESADQRLHRKACYTVFGGVGGIPGNREHFLIYGELIDDRLPFRPDRNGCDRTGLGRAVIEVPCVVFRIRSSVCQTARDTDIAKLLFHHAETHRAGFVCLYAEGDTVGLSDILRAPCPDRIRKLDLRGDTVGRVLVNVAKVYHHGLVSVAVHIRDFKATAVCRPVVVPVCVAVLPQEEGRFFGVKIIGVFQRRIRRAVDDFDPGLPRDFLHRKVVDIHIEVSDGTVIVPDVHARVSRYGELVECIIIAAAGAEPCREHARIG